MLAFLSFLIDILYDEYLHLKILYSLQLQYAHDSICAFQRCKIFVFELLLTELNWIQYLERDSSKSLYPSLKKNYPPYNLTCFPRI